MRSKLKQEISKDSFMSLLHWAVWFFRGIYALSCFTCLIRHDSMQCTWFTLGQKVLVLCQHTGLVKGVCVCVCVWHFHLRWLVKLMMALLSSIRVPTGHLLCMSHWTVQDSPAITSWNYGSLLTHYYLFSSNRVERGGCWTNSWLVNGHLDFCKISYSAVIVLYSSTSVQNLRNIVSVNKTRLLFLSSLISALVVAPWLLSIEPSRCHHTPLPPPPLLTPALPVHLHL